MPDEKEENVELTEPKKDGATKKPISEPKKKSGDEVDWSKEFSFTFDKKRFAELLHNHGILTRQDFLNAGVPKIASLIMSMYMADAQNLTVQVRQNMNKEV